MSEGPDGTTIVVDTREPDEVKLLTLSHPDVDNWMETELDAADIVVNGVGFERKTPSDFASSLMEGRLDEQAEKLVEVYDHAKILLEGGFEDFSSLPHTSINAASLRGKAASLDMRYGLAVVPTGGSPETETARRLLIDMAIRYGRKATEDPTSDYLSTGAAGTDEPLGKRLWACFEGVGPQRAEDLFSAVGAPMDIGYLTHGDKVDRLMDVEGIGETTAERIASAFDTSTPTSDGTGETATEAPDGEV